MELNKPVSGVYEIKNTVTGRVYIGQSITIQARIANHFASLSRGKHFNQLLQKEYRKYGPDAFSYRIVAILEKSELKIIEMDLVFRLLLSRKKLYNTDKLGNGYKEARVMGRLLDEASEKKAEIIREWVKGRISREEISDKIAKIRVTGGYTVFW
jgi:group I intron endonuclease